MKISPITVQTCEDVAAGERAIPLIPRETERTSLFRLADPFGTRTAVAPLFLMNGDGDLEGLGTAFALDPWGRFATADHVIADHRDKHRPMRGAVDRPVKMPSDESFVALLGYGLVFGDPVRLPPEAVARVIAAWSPAFHGDDPMAALQGRPDIRPLDLAILTIQLSAENRVANLPITSRSRGPRPGDVVVALGYPQIDTFSGGLDEARTVISEGMFAAYGQVTKLHPRGRDSANPTPVFEVAANWPRGMSGGPVFDAGGQVVGLVSRGLEPAEGKEIGVAWATWFEAFADLGTWIPSLDPCMSAGRRGWAVLRESPWRLVAVKATEAEAQAVATTVGTDHIIRHGLWTLGTDDFVS